MPHQFMYPKVVSISVGSGFGTQQQSVAFPASQVAPASHRDPVGTSRMR